MQPGSLHLTVSTVLFFTQENFISFLTKNFAGTRKRRRSGGRMKNRKIVFYWKIYFSKQFLPIAKVFPNFSSSTKRYWFFFGFYRQSEKSDDRKMQFPLPRQSSFVPRKKRWGPEAKELCMIFRPSSK